MLNDRIINAAQKLIKKKFPLVGGLQDPLLSQLSFNRCTSEGIQIHNTGKCHWITSSCIGGQPVSVYDSLYDDLTESSEIQLVQCYNNCVDQAGQLHIEMASFQKQKGSTDCGLFAIASAYELASGNTHFNYEVPFEQKAMREHLIACFENEELSSFPRAQKAAAMGKNNEKLLSIQTHCVCQLPECGDMVQCDLCDMWYHLACTNLSQAPGESDDWLCQSCAPLL
ncbi:uncharacterized protein LOC114530708 [Dendronephthya gigantea]|uniref:uncharacterized protein LOC114530708 n=1 Tax=Dendronephthya gigantea TaxID=151771 RepID=UPI00106BB2C8|nr:uncharacterized protein LOC114530708 [Dendronephthya gigantea]